MATTLGQLKRDFTAKANAVELLVECLGDGSPDSEILIVAEAPGHRECELKMPLVGGSGSFLWKVLGEFGIQRRHCYVTNVIKRRIVEQQYAKSKEVPKNELAHWHALLDWELSQLPNVKHVLVLGNYALEALVGIDGIDKWRGSVLFNAGKAYIVANNPAHILRKSYLEPIFKQDIYKLKMVRAGEWREHNIKHLFDPSPKEAIAWCDKMIQEDAPVSFDIETISGETACVGFANNAHEGMSINFRERDRNRWSLADERNVRYAIQRVLRHARVRLVAQNGGFDAGWLWFVDRIRCKPLYIDTLLGHHTLYPIWPHNLGFLTAQYTTHPYYKDDSEEWREGADISTFWQYNVKDVCITWEVARRIEQELRRDKLWDFFQNHVMRLQPYLINATVLGNRIDLQMRERLNVEYEKSVEQLRDSFVQQARTLTGNAELEVNPNSPKQLVALLFGSLKLTGKSLSTDAKNLQGIAESVRTAEPVRNMLNTLNTYKREHKLLSVYITAKVDNDNRMRSDYKQYGTQFVPGRLSSAQTLWGSGMNLQNQPERLRGMFIADEGYCYVYFDGAQAEARIVAYEAGIAKWKEQFERARLNPGSYDAHIALASEMFKIPYDEVPKNDYNEDGTIAMRGIAKRCRHGLNYRMQAARLATTAKIPLSLANEAYRLYHQTTPELQVWWERIIYEVHTTRQLFTCLGRRIIFPGSKIDDDLLDAVIAFKPQSTLGDFVCSVQYKAQEDEAWPRTARIPFNNHDSLVAMCRHTDYLRVAQILRKYAEAPLLIKGEQLIIPSEFKVSQADEKGLHRWDNMKKLKDF